MGGTTQADEVVHTGRWLGADLFAVLLVPERYATSSCAHCELELQLLSGNLPLDDIRALVALVVILDVITQKYNPEPSPHKLESNTNQRINTSIVSLLPTIGTNHKRI